MTSVKPVDSRYGMLTPLHFVSCKGWLCRCDCGNEKFIDGNDLRKYQYLSCGCQSRALQVRSLRQTLAKKRLARLDSPPPVKKFPQHGAPCWVCRNKTGSDAEMSLCFVCRGET